MVYSEDCIIMLYLIANKKAACGSFFVILHLHIRL